MIVMPCPSCGDYAGRTAYDIGSGLELCCAVCDWCWGVMGQPLNPADTHIPDALTTRCQCRACVSGE